MQKSCKIILLFLLLNLTSCVVYPSDGGQYGHNAPQYGGGGGAYYGVSCLRNPYVFRLDPGAWQRWEKDNYHISCTRLQTGGEW